MSPPKRRSVRSPGGNAVPKRSERPARGTDTAEPRTQAAVPG